MDSQVLLLLVFLAPFIFLLLIKHRKKSIASQARRRHLIGNLHKLSDDGLPHQVLERLAAKYGDLMSADLIYSKEVLAMTLLSFNPYGEYWREVRKIVIFELLSANRVQMFQSVRDEEVGLILKSTVHCNGPVNISELTLFLANNVLSRLAFGKKYDAGGEIGKNRLHE
ncbi:hypothetical protein ACFX15_038217 [Malus domestica]